jgi:hypothetical protein
VGLFGFNVGLLVPSWGGLISIACERRLADPGECGGLTGGGTKGVDSGAGKLGNAL